MKCYFFGRGIGELLKTSLRLPLVLRALPRYVMNIHEKNNLLVLNHDYALCRSLFSSFRSINKIRANQKGTALDVNPNNK